MRIADTVGRFFRAVDQRDWATIRSLSADELSTDYTSVFGGQPEKLAADDLLARWQGLLPGFEATQHFLGPLLGEDSVVDDEGVVECNVRGYHHLHGRTWMIAGWYALLVRREGDDQPWQIAGIDLRSSYETGDRELVTLAEQRAAAR